MSIDAIKTVNTCLQRRSGNHLPLWVDSYWRNVACVKSKARLSYQSFTSSVWFLLTVTVANAALFNARRSSPERISNPSDASLPTFAFAHHAITLSANTMPCCDDFCTNALVTCPKKAADEWISMVYIINNGVLVDRGLPRDRLPKHCLPGLSFDRSNFEATKIVFRRMQRLRHLPRCKL